MPGRDGTFRIFAFTDELPAVVVVPALIFLLGLLSLGALYAGFAAARAVRAPTLGARRQLGRDHRPDLGARDGAALDGGRRAVPRRCR